MTEAVKKLHPATYADLEAVPPPRVAELIEGTLYTFPRPAPKHGVAATNLSGELYGPFGRGHGGPGGWIIIDEPEIHFPEPSAPEGIVAIVPDLAGWRRERMPKLPKTAYFTLAPDWICEVLSRSTAAIDRTEKMPLYAREGVKHAWLVDPVLRTLEVFRMTQDGWLLAAVHRDDDRVRSEPFEAFELDLSVLWEDDDDDQSAK